MGSKNFTAKRIIDFLPPARTFYDLFCGGCAVTHAAILSGKYQRFIINDINAGIVELFKGAVSGKYANEDRWISREDFFRLKDSDPYVAYCWSFGNNPDRQYLYSRQIEPYKKACHYAIVFDDWAGFDRLCPEVAEACKASLSGMNDRKERRKTLGRTIVAELKRIDNAELLVENPLYKSCHKKRPVEMQSLERLQSLRGLESLQSLERLRGLESLQSLERLERLQSLQCLERLTAYTTSYNAVPLDDADGVIYCDIPYRGTTAYTNCTAFDYNRFYGWCCAQALPVYVSEYNLPDPRFECVYEMPKMSRLAASGKSKSTERLYAPKTNLAHNQGRIRLHRGQSQARTGQAAADGDGN